MKSTGKATYPWEYPSDWLEEKVKTMSENELRSLVMTVFRSGGEDMVIEHFDGDLKAEGFYNSVQTCERCTDHFDAGEELFETELGDGPMHKACAELTEAEEDDDLLEEVDEEEDDGE